MVRVRVITWVMIAALLLLAFVNWQVRSQVGSVQEKKLAPAWSSWSGLLDSPVKSYLGPDGTWPACGNVQLPTDPTNCCGPWLCEYYDNVRLEGQPVVVVAMDSLSTDWQRQRGWGYDGVPALADRKSSFSIKCSLSKHFEKGKYAFIPFCVADAVSLALDGRMVASMEGRKSSTFRQPLPLQDIAFGHHEVVLTAIIERDSRSFLMLAWVEVQREDLTVVQRALCMTSSECYGPMASCDVKHHEGLSQGEAPWGLCQDYVEDPNTCVVYSFGIRDIFENELLMGRHGCEVHAFDCTVDLAASLGENVHFHKWCLGKGSEELKLDGLLSGENHETMEFLSLPDIIKRLGHEETTLTVLKMDCEGCEWDALDTLLQEMPGFFWKINMLMLELHFVTAVDSTLATREKEVETMARVSEGLRNYRTYGYSINSDTDRTRFSDPKYYAPLFKAGLHMGACCYEVSLVRKDLAHI